MKPRKNQKCTKCGKLLKDDWAYNGKWWCGECKDKDSAERIIKYMDKSAVRKSRKAILNDSVFIPSNTNKVDRWRKV